MSEVQKNKEIVPYSCSPRSSRRVLSSLGDKYMIRSKLSIGDKGEQIAEPGDKVDFQAYIQASKASTDIATIIARYNAGDESVLNARVGFSGDVDLIPSSVNDVNKINKLSDAAYESFNKLPEDVKKLFGSPEDFFNAVLNNKAEEILKNYKPAEVVKEKENEVSE